ncbi:MAG TPA: ATP-binding protein [Candidatus Sulfotelmatobacter sp.]|nr:ATP-binding protein [Candidatus Sulfotelmatobacter sp.]
MSKTLLAILVLCLLGPAFAGANEPAPSARVNEDSDWKDFNELVASAKSSMMGNPEAALAIARNAAAFAQNHPGSAHQTEALATSLWLEAEALTRMNRVPEARSTLDHAIQLATQNHKITKLDGDLALSLARIADNSGDVALALRSLHKAHDIFASLGEARSQAMALQGLGSIYDEAHDFDREIEYYHRASRVYSGDPALELSAANNVGFALQQLGRYDEAIADFRRALEISSSLHSDFLKARVLTNLAAVYAKRHQFSNADKAANDALRLLGKNDQNGWAPFVWGVKAELEYERGALDAAASDLEKTFRGVDLSTTIAPFRDIHEIAYKVYRAKGNQPLALAHLEAFKRLDDEGRSLSASANLALIGARFDFATQQLEIEHLKSEQLKRDISLRESRAATQTAIFSSLLLLSILLIMWISWRNLSVRRHRNEITRANITLTKTLAERDIEIERRIEIESELRQAKDAAEEANRAKAQFLANMSHELRTPLNAIIGFSEIMSNETLGPVGTQAYKGYASDIVASGRHLLSILNDILDMARIDAGKITPADDDLVLGDVVENALRVFADEVREPGKKIRVSSANPDLRVRADERMLRQILINLISNAVKFTRNNGLIEIRIEPTEDGIDLVVRDNGIGIPEDKLALVMEPFGHADDAFARSRGGIGLGLPIVQSLVTLHGGRFSLASKPNEGTTATVHLPADRVLHLPEYLDGCAVAS